MSPVRIPLVDQIDALLPQTQCTKCGTAGCRPYAEEIAAGQAPHNRCVPGGADTIAELAALLQQPVLPLDPAFGVEPVTRRVAFIREAECIGCTKCIQACPVDAIVGAAKLMHSIIRDECTGCDLCIPPCPVDCIEIHDFPKITDPDEKRAMAAHNRMRFEARNARLVDNKTDAVPDAALPASLPDATTAPVADKSRVIAAAMARTNLKKAERKLAAARESGEPLAELEAEVGKLREEVVRLS